MSGAAKQAKAALALAKQNIVTARYHPLVHAAIASAVRRHRKGLASLPEHEELVELLHPEDVPEAP